MQAFLLMWCPLIKRGDIAFFTATRFFYLDDVSTQYCQELSAKASLFVSQVQDFVRA